MVWRVMQSTTRESVFQASFLKAVMLEALEFLQKPLTISPWDVKPLVNQIAPWVGC